MTRTPVLKSSNCQARGAPYMACGAELRTRQGDAVVLLQRCECVREGSIRSGRVNKFVCVREGEPADVEAAFAP